MPYHSPHKFRHGHAVHSLKSAKDIAALKAASQNLVHENLSITDGLYGILSDLDIREQITMLGKNVAGSRNKKDLVVILEQLLEELDIDVL